MFNLKRHNPGYEDQSDLLKSELSSLDIIVNHDDIQIKVGDEVLHVNSFGECLSVIAESIKELKSLIWQEWHDLQNIAEVITNNDSGNNGSIDNIFFLNSVKKSYLLASLFDELSDILPSLKKVFYIDAASVHKNLVARFNHSYLYIKLLHYLIMSQIYRTLVIKRYMNLRKLAQVSGPWANLDLPMQERIWEFDEGEEEYFEDRKKARREQTRYNPEYNQLGFFFVWQDLSLGPYNFTDMSKSSPYKSRTMLTIACREYSP